ncbi:MAG: Fic family protein [Flavobacteriales bacterium]|nr:Fic family protein [Flavobacteriales bacterium]
MPQNIHTFYLDLTMKLMSELSTIDRFDASWAQIEKREGQTLKQLKTIATVRSVGASTRIEGSKMTDNEVEVLIDELKISKLEERDQQEVAGYFEALDTITESYKDIIISEGNLKNLHKILMSHCDKDEWHRGEYKQISNSVEANHQDGTKQIVFETTEPGFATEQAMRDLLEWYHSDKETLPIVKAALFVYDFLSIHPFQDGNGRLSRLLGTLLLLRSGYTWIQYVSFEHEIEHRKVQYYKVLMKTQKQRPGEKVDEWTNFFLDCLLNIQDQLMSKLDSHENSSSQLAPRTKNILGYIENHPGCKSSDISEKLRIPQSTVKKALTTMVKNKIILKYGVGAGTNYLAEKTSPLQSDLMFKLTNETKTKEFLLMGTSSYVEIKKIILTPLFEWTKPDEWSVKLMNQGLCFKVTVISNTGSTFSQPYALTSFNNAHYFQPVFTLNKPIRIPLHIKNEQSNLNEYPMTIKIELDGSVSVFDFDVTFVYDEM